MQEWKSLFFAFSLIIEGTTEKVLQFYPDYVNFQSKPWFQWKKMYFLTLQTGPNNTKSLN
jgi:hypothetical protein